jgi:hypothetical protein
MRIRLGGVVAILSCLGLVASAQAAAVDCGPAPSVKCLATAVFATARTLPDDFYRRHVAFAEQELAPGDVKIALDYVVSDSPDPSPWEDIEWIARAGRFDRAIKVAKERTSPVERLGGMLAVATAMLDKNERLRAQKIVEDAERELPSVPRDGNDQYVGVLPSLAGEVWAGLGQPDRAARLVSGEGATSVDNLMAIASRYPAVAARLREQAWLEAERANELRAWQQLIESAISRGDQVEIASAAARAGKAIGNTPAAHDPHGAIQLASAFLKAGAPDLAARLVKPWPQWVYGKGVIDQFNVADTLIPILVGLGDEDEIWKVAGAVNDVSDRSRCLSTASREYFRLGQSEVGGKFDAEALALAESSPAAGTTRVNKDFLLHNLALFRAGRGDVEGALALVGKISDGKKAREVTGYVVRAAIANGHGPDAALAIEALRRIADTVPNAELRMTVAESWYAVGREDDARRTLSLVLKERDDLPIALKGREDGRVAELMWRLDGAGKPEAMIEIVDKIGVTDPGAIDRLIEVIRPVSPVVALQLANRQTEVTRRIDELANIATQIATKSN